MAKKNNKMTKKEKDELMQDYNVYSRELLEYGSRARKLGYKPPIPKLPKKDQAPELMRSTIMGFRKRFGNWKENFKKFEESKAHEKQVFGY